MIPVHVHSEYSALDGYNKPEEIADRLLDLGLAGSFLTDHGTVAGLDAFRKAMTAKGLFAGYGMEAYQAKYGRKVNVKPDGKKYIKGEDSYHLILLATSPEGYRNLLRLSDAANRTGFYYDPRLDFELLKEHREGIIVTSACMGSLVNQELLNGEMTAFEEFVRLYDEDFLIELHTYDTDEQRELNQVLATLAHDRGLKVVYSTDAHYAVPEQWEIHEQLITSQYNKEKWNGPKKHSNYEDDERQYHHPPCLYIMGEEEVRKRLDYLPEAVVDQAIETSDWLMQKCSFELEKPGTYLPKYKAPEDTTSKILFIDIVEAGLKRLYTGTEYEDEAWRRTNYEMEAIIDAGLHDYFLIVWDYINHALENGMFVGPGRGSVGGSIIAYTMGITSIDPLKYDLSFERFWNPGRADGLPDIDIDFGTEDRQTMIEYVRNKYGNVLVIGNHSSMHPKGAIRRAASILYDTPPFQPLKKISDLIDKTIDAGLVQPWDKMWEILGEMEDPHPLQKYVDEYPEMFKIAEKLSGRISNYAVHASAVVISEVDLHDKLPARALSDTVTKGKKIQLVTQADMRQVEKAGFPKFDFLGLRNLDTIMRAALLSGDFGEDTLETRKEIVRFFRHGIDWESLPDDFWQAVDRGHTLGFFQIMDKPGAKRIAMEIKPRRIEDLGLVVALNRPGPDYPEYIARRNGKEFDYVCAPHEVSTEETFGMFIYQEQVIRYFREIGYSPSDADHIRKILGKKLVDLMQAEYPRYLDFAIQHMETEQAELIWSNIEDFSKYSFNKAHSVGYGMITAWTMYAKWKWPTAYVMASMETDEERLAAWINEARRIEVPVLAPDINRSERLVQLIDGAIMYGLQNIKGLGASHAKWIVKNRPYRNPEDFVWACANVDDTITVDRGRVKKISDAGALDTFGYRVAQCDTCGGRGRYRLDPKVRKLLDCPYCITGWMKAEIPPVDERAVLEEELLGIALTDVNQELISQNKKRIEKLDPIWTATMDEKKKIKVPGVITNVRPTVVRKSGVPMGHFTIAWQGEEVRLTAFPEAWNEYGYMLKRGVVGEFKIETGPKGPTLIGAEKYVGKKL